MKNHNRLLTPLLICAAFFSGCINDPVNSYTAAKYYQAGEEAEANANLMGARIAYSRSYINTQLGHMPSEAQAHSLYEWARVSGYLGYFDGANKGFSDVIDLIDKSEGRAESLRAPTYCEQARLLRDRGQDQKAIPIYSKAIQELEKQKADQSYPVGFATFLDDYEQALRNSGAKEEADRVAVHSTSLKEKRAGGGAENAVSKNFRVAGQAAQNRNDWNAAKINWWRAVNSEETARVPPSVLAVSYYEYGRSLGVVGEFAAAETYLRKALTADRESGGNFFLDLTELARLNYDQKKFPEALAYYEQELPVLDAHNAEQTGPAGLIEILTECSDCLKKVGREGEAKKVDDRIAAIKAKNSVLHSITDRTPYGKNPKPQVPKGES